MPESEVIEGALVKDVHTLKSIYDGGFIQFTHKGKECRISVNWLKELMKDYFFVIEKKKRYWHVVDATTPSEMNLGKRGGQ